MTHREPLVIGVDVGGSKVLAGRVDHHGRVHEPIRLRTPGRRVEVSIVEDTLLDAVVRVAEGRRIDAVGVAAAGFVDVDRERVLFAPHLPWRGEHLTDRLAARLDAPVVLDNDANCAAVAEGRYGAASGASSAVLVTLGTGIGGAVLVDGRLWRGVNGMAGEFGHMQLVPGGLRCECGGSGCWEQYCSGNALVRDARTRVGTTDSLLDQLCGGVADQLTGPMIAEAAAAADREAVAAFAAIGHWLGVGLANLAAAMDPARMVIGGGVSDAGGALLGPARTAMSSSLVAASERTVHGHRVRVVPDIVRATLGPEAGIVGAAALARDLLRPGQEGLR